jgi:hypothetical protein
MKIQTLLLTLKLDLRAWTSIEASVKELGGFVTYWSNGTTLVKLPGTTTQYKSDPIGFAEMLVGMDHALVPVVVIYEGGSMIAAEVTGSTFGGLVGRVSQ